MKQTKLKGCSTLNFNFFFYQNLIFNEMVVMKAITILEQRTNNSSDDKSSIKTTMIITIGNQ